MEKFDLSRFESAPEHTKDDIIGYFEKFEKIHADIEKTQIESIEKKAEAARERIQQEGINMETMTEVIKTLETTNFEAFSAAEIKYMADSIDNIIVEVDPAFKQFYRDLKQRLIDIIPTKLAFEKMQK